MRFFFLLYFFFYFFYGFLVFWVFKGFSGCVLGEGDWIGGVVYLEVCYFFDYLSWSGDEVELLVGYGECFGEVVYCDGFFEYVVE